MTDRELFDVGLQPERTELAWRRTALSLASASLVSVRVLPELLGSPLWALFGLVGAGFSVYLWSAARRRYVHFNRCARATSPIGFPGGRQLLAVTVFTTACGLVSVAVLARAA
ncbi:uncharacterized protein DUF202 [Kribbella sp. VKM Ac-2569]|uniref:DUF202 domain-containing protein n=1 Tax=Kribbella sp. VKM Ac-2569 TaxID=2512220 RepID=UPI00102ACC18|nr:DUF202 domain-containing protein [Kribbella sp. VKM Ac-2569]RZT27507.1 uncharacterized protein DUF202 [Kribbella sp. VKM Ac-2569]